VRAEKEKGSSRLDGQTCSEGEGPRRNQDSCTEKNIPACEKEERPRGGGEKGVIERVISYVWGKDLSCQRNCHQGGGETRE